MIPSWSTTIWAFWVDVTAKCTLMCALGLLGSLALRRSTAAARHLVWLVTTVCVFAMPVLTCILPRWNVSPPRFAVHSRHAVVSLPTLSERESTPITAAALDRDFAASRAAGVHIAISPTLPMSASVAPPRHGAEHAVSPVSRGAIASTIVLSLWLIGFAFGVVRLMAAFMGMRLLRSRSFPVVESAITGLLEETRNVMGVRRPVALLWTPDRHAAHVPVTWGAIRPAIILSEPILSRSAATVKTILLHETAHIRRKDWLAEILAQATRTLYWFNPFVLFATHRLHTEAERACDDRVLLAGVTPAAYARTLLEIIQTVKNSKAQPGLCMAHPPIEQRVRAILTPGTNRSASRSSVAAAAIVLAAGGAMVLATIHVGAAPQAVQPAQTHRATQKQSKVTVARKPADGQNAQLRRQVEQLRRQLAMNQAEKAALMRQLQDVRKQSLSIAKEQAMLRRLQEHAALEASETAAAVDARKEVADLRSQLDDMRTKYTDTHPRIAQLRDRLQEAKQRLAEVQAKGGDEAARKSYLEALGYQPLKSDKAGLKFQDDQVNGIVSKLLAEEKRSVEAQDKANAAARQSEMEQLGAQLNALNAQQAALQERMKINEARVRAGIESQDDLLESKVAVEQSQANIAAVKAQMAQLRAGNTSQKRGDVLRDHRLAELMTMLSGDQSILHLREELLRNKQEQYRAGAVDKDELLKSQADVVELKAQMSEVQREIADLKAKLPQQPANP